MKEPRTPGRVFAFGEFRLFADERMVMRNDDRVRMTPRAFDLLLMLVENAGRLVTKETLLTEVWQDSFVEEGNINSTVSRLRKMLGEKPNENLFIETVPKVGYRFIADVEYVEAEVRATPASRKTDETVGVPTVDRPRRKWPIAVAALLLSASVLFGVWFARQRVSTSTAAQNKKNVPVRLTDNPTHDSRATLTTDGQIRFGRLFGTDLFTFIMNGDGTNARRDTSIPGLKNGV